MREYMFLMYVGFDKDKRKVEELKKVLNKAPFTDIIRYESHEEGKSSTQFTVIGYYYYYENALKEILQALKKINATYINFKTFVEIEDEEMNIYWDLDLEKERPLQS